MDHHKTRVPYIYGYIDDNYLTIRGWLINIRMRSCVNATLFRAIEEKSQEQLAFKYGTPRPDVRDVYKLLSDECEFHITRNDPSSPVLIQMFMFDEWKTVLEVPKCQNPVVIAPPVVTIPEPVEESLSSNTALHRDVIVVDEFYENPEIVRQMGLSGNTNALPSLTELKFFLEQIVGGKIVSVDDSGFEVNIAENITAITGDTKPNSYYANVFLTPNAPVNAGISLYRSKDTGKRTFVPNVHSKVCRDITRFEIIDKVGNVYNRLVIWNANLLHGPSCYFGNTKENGRLVQTFKFTTMYP